MKTAEQLIAKYESARQKIKRLESVRLNEISKCLRIQKPVRISEISKCQNIQDKADDWDGKNCLVTAWDDMTHLNAVGGDFYTYDEVLYSSEEYCEHCLEAYRIKRGELAQAKQDLGKVKRALSARGKFLIKNELTED